MKKRRLRAAFLLKGSQVAFDGYPAQTERWRPAGWLAGVPRLHPVASLTRVNYRRSVDDG